MQVTGEAAAEADWPEIGPLIEAQVRTLRPAGTPVAGPASFPDGLHKSEFVYGRQSAIRALACRCGADVDTAPAQAARRQRPGR